MLNLQYQVGLADGRIGAVGTTVQGTFQVAGNVLSSGQVGTLTAPGAFTGGRMPFAILTNLLLIQSLGIHDSDTWNGPAWSISTEFYTYLVFAAACLLARGWTRRIVALASDAVLAAPLPVLPLADAAAIADFILGTDGLGKDGCGAWRS